MLTKTCRYGNASLPGKVNMIDTKNRHAMGAKGHNKNI